MALIDVVYWEGTPDVFAYKFPENNLTTWTQLIVNESQEAVLFHKGKLVQKFGPGKHVLSTENIPLLENLYGIPFGGKNPFTAEVWFVNKVMVLDVKWGTRTPMQLRDPEYKVMVPVRAFGQFGVQIADAESFLVKLVGTLPLFDRTVLADCFRGVVLTVTASAIARKIVEDKVSVLEVSAHLQRLSDFVRDEMRSQVADYGVNLCNFFVNSINIDENDSAVAHLKELLSKKAEMDVLGYTYQQERSFDVLGTAAQNEGMSGTMMGTGMGLGMGFGVGGAVGGMMGNMAQYVKDEMVSCPGCHAQMAKGARFCPSCGKGAEAPAAPLPKPKIKCDKCGQEMDPGVKFCPSCGDTYNPCLECGADNDANAVTCGSCGKPLPKPCPKCGSRVAGEIRFCPDCGERLQRLCPGCGKPVTGFRFCPECGTKSEE